jgi:hypothetical protein
VHLLWEGRVGGSVQFSCNKVRVEGCIVKAFMCKEITNFSSTYFSRVNNVKSHTTQYIVVEVPLSEL